jgi:hypothetical protein
VKTRRGFLRAILAAPVAAVVAAAGLSKWDRLQRLGVLTEEFSFPASSAYIGPKLTRIQGELAITGDAMKAIYGGGLGGGKTEMQRHLNRETAKVLEYHREEMDRIYGHHTAALSSEIDEMYGVR